MGLEYRKIQNLEVGDQISTGGRHAVILQIDQAEHVDMDEVQGDGELVLCAAIHDDHFDPLDYRIAKAAGDRDETVVMFPTEGGILNGVMEAWKRRDDVLPPIEVEPDDPSHGGDQ